MGANMQKQAVPLLVAESPFIGTGIEAWAAKDAGEVITAEGSGRVVEVSGEVIAVEYRAGQKDRFGNALGLKRYAVAKFLRSNQNTCINQKILVSEGNEVQQGDVLADGPSTHNGELALGKNLLVAFMPWEGYNYEDAIVLSERLVRDDRVDVDPHRRARDRRGEAPSSVQKRSPATSRICPRRSSPTWTSAASSASAPRSARATCWSARSHRKARPSSRPKSGSSPRSSAKRRVTSATPG